MGDFDGFLMHSFSLFDGATTQSLLEDLADAFIWSLGQHRVEIHYLGKTFLRLRNEAMTKTGSSH